MRSIHDLAGEVADRKLSAARAELAGLICRVPIGGNG
jgi:hypothetical protein